MKVNVLCSHLYVISILQRLVRVLPTNIQALSLYSLCQETLSFTPRAASRSFSSLINFTFVSGLKNRENLEASVSSATSGMLQSAGFIFFDNLSLQRFKGQMADY